MAQGPINIPFGLEVVIMEQKLDGYKKALEYNAQS